MPGVVTKSMSSPSSLKNPLSRATSTGRSCTAFMMATCGFFAAAGLRVMVSVLMALSWSELKTEPVLPSSHQRVGAGREERLHGDRLRDDALLAGARDHLLQRLAIRRDAVGQGIAPRHLHYAR